MSRLAHFSVVLALCSSALPAKAEPASRCSSSLLADADGTVIGQATQLTPTTVQATPCRGASSTEVAYLIIDSTAYKVAPGEVVLLPEATR